eukprot:gene1018-570_t
MVTSDQSSKPTTFDPHKFIPWPKSVGMSREERLKTGKGWGFAKCKGGSAQPRKRSQYITAEELAAREVEHWHRKGSEHSENTEKNTFAKPLSQQFLDNTATAAENDQSQSSHWDLPAYYDFCQNHPWASCGHAGAKILQELKVLLDDYSELMKKKDVFDKEVTHIETKIKSRSVENVDLVKKEISRVQKRFLPAWNKSELHKRNAIFACQQKLDDAFQEMQSSFSAPGWHFLHDPTDDDTTVHNKTANMFDWLNGVRHNHFFLFVTVGMEAHTTSPARGYTIEWQQAVRRFDAIDAHSITQNMKPAKPSTKSIHPSIEALALDLPSDSRFWNLLSSRVDLQQDDDLRNAKPGLLSISGHLWTKYSWHACTNTYPMASLLVKMQFLYDFVLVRKFKHPHTDVTKFYSYACQALWSAYHHDNTRELALRDSVFKAGYESQLPELESQRLQSTMAHAQTVDFGNSMYQSSLTQEQSKSKGKGERPTGNVSNANRDVGGEGAHAEHCIRLDERGHEVFLGYSAKVRTQPITPFINEPNCFGVAKFVIGLFRTAIKVYPLLNARVFSWLVRTADVRSTYDDLWLSGCLPEVANWAVSSSFTQIIDSDLWTCLPANMCHRLIRRTVFEFVAVYAVFVSWPTSRANQITDLIMQFGDGHVFVCLYSRVYLYAIIREAAKFLKHNPNGDPNSILAKLRS